MYYEGFRNSPMDFEYKGSEISVMSYFCIAEPDPDRINAASSPKGYRKFPSYKSFMKFVETIQMSGDTLIIIDKYIFPAYYTYDHYYPDLLIDAIKETKAKKVVFITSETHNEWLANRIWRLLKEEGIDSRIGLTERFHDRFWIMLRKFRGFSMGTSLNSLGQCVTRLKKLDSDEILMLIEEVEKVLGVTLKI